METTIPSKRPRSSMKCPICGVPVAYAKGKPLPIGFPFCSERCKMIDLNNWFTEEYTLSRELTDEERRRLDPDEMSREDLLALVRDLRRRAAESESDEENPLVV